MQNVCLLAGFMYKKAAILQSCKIQMYCIIYNTYGKDSSKAYKLHVARPENWPLRSEGLFHQGKMLSSCKRQRCSSKTKELLVPLWEDRQVCLYLYHEHVCFPKPAWYPAYNGS